LVLVAALGALTAFALPRTGGAANPLLVATVKDDGTITLKNQGGDTVTTLAPGTYDIDVHDDSAFHNFHLTGPGVDEKTSVPLIENPTWTVTLMAGGTYHFECDAHAYMQGDFTVTAGATSTATTGSASSPSTTGPTTTTVPPATTTAPPKAGPGEPCVVPKLVGRTLRAAKRRLALTSCRLGRVTRAYSRRVARGRVISQRPKAGRRVGNGTAVALVVSRGRR
jgi:hypothetical protein